jgi:MCP family monocarboxylic acid transporter-like MFS transporter 10
LITLRSVLIYIDVSASAASVSPNLSVYFLVIANFVGATGRISMGILADKFGCLSVMIPATFVAGLTTYAWPFAKDVSSLIVVAIMYG